MTHADDDRDPLAAEDADFVRRIADAYTPAPMTAARRAALDAELEERLARDRWRFAPWAASLLAAGAAVLLLVRLPGAPVTQIAPTDAASDESYVFALAGESADDFDSALPSDYQAIAQLIELE